MATTWSSDELSRIEEADELEMAPRRPDGTLRGAVPIWVVRHGDDLYVRSYRGRGGTWFRTAQASHQGHVRAGGVDKDVAFVEETDGSLNDRIDAAYRTKYRRYGAQYVNSIVDADSRAATIRLVPR